MSPASAGAPAFVLTITVNVVRSRFVSLWSHSHPALINSNAAACVVQRRAHKGITHRLSASRYARRCRTPMHKAPLGALPGQTRARVDQETPAAEQNPRVTGWRAGAGTPLAPAVLEVGRVQHRGIPRSADGSIREGRVDAALHKQRRDRARPVGGDDPDPGRSRPQQARLAAADQRVTVAHLGQSRSRPPSGRPARPGQGSSPPPRGGAAWSSPPQDPPRAPPWNHTSGRAGAVPPPRGRGDRPAAVPSRPLPHRRRPGRSSCRGRRRMGGGLTDRPRGAGPTRRRSLGKPERRPTSPGAAASAPGEGTAVSGSA